MTASKSNQKKKVTVEQIIKKANKVNNNCSQFRPTPMESTHNTHGLTYAKGLVEMFFLAQNRT